MGLPPILVYYDLVAEGVTFHLSRISDGDVLLYGQVALF